MTKKDVEREISILKKEAEKFLKDAKEKAPKGLFKKIVSIIVIVLVAREALKRFKAKNITDANVKVDSRTRSAKTGRDSSWDVRR